MSVVHHSDRYSLSCCMFLFLEFKPVPGAFVGWAANLAASLLVVVFGFLFVTVSSRIVGLVGSRPALSPE